jgi:D-galactarolactone cycloisomerase
MISNPLRYSLSHSASLFRGNAELAAMFETPIAAGEQECPRWGFRDLIEHRATDILQPDVTVVGGVTEWMIG